MAGPGGILALDLSLTTGFAYGVLGERPVFGHWNLGKMARSGEAFCVLEDNIDDAIKLFKPRAVVYEAPLPPKRSGNGNDTIKLILGLCAVAELISVRHLLPYYHQNLMQARSKVLGKAPVGKSGTIKPIIMAWAGSRGWDVNGQDDAADALLLLAYSTVILDKTGKSHFFRHGELL